MTATLILAPALRDRLIAEARDAAPSEACGLLEGVRAGDNVTVTGIHPAANAAPDPRDSFAIDPAFHFALQRNLRAAGVSEMSASARDGGPAAVGRPRGAAAQSAAGVSEIIGCFHSHPNGQPAPSRRDRENGCADGFVWIIIATGVIDAVRAFSGPAFTPLTIRE